MSKQFLKASEVSLKNGGYLVVTDGEKPVSNVEFVAAQRSAEYVITYARLAAGKDFTGKKADSLLELETEVRASLAAKQRTFVEKPTIVEQTLTRQLRDEALSFINFQEDSTKADKINKFLSQFEVVAEFEDFGLFFSEDIVKLNKIYTMDEVVTAVTSVIDLLDK